MSYKFQAFLVSVCMFFVSLFYGDAPINIKLDCSIPSETYVYEQGDMVTLELSATNLGIPFEDDDQFYKAVAVEIYQLRYGQNMYIYRSWMNPTDDSMGKPIVVFKNMTQTTYDTFKIPEHALKGFYNAKVIYKGHTQIFENIFEVV